MPAIDRNIRDLVLLRYVLIIAVSYLMISQGDAGGIAPAAAVMVAAALASNVLLGWSHPARLTPLQVASAIVLVDIVWISLSLATLQSIGTEFFFLYFFVLFFAALADNLLLMLLGVLGASAAYLWVLARLHPGSVWTQAHLLQISFLFSAALFYGVLVSRTRESRREAELIEATDRERTELLATLAHDIGGPAHTISLGVEAIEETLDEAQTDAEFSSIFAAVSRNSRYLRQLALRFMEYSRLRSGRYELRPTALSVRGIVEQVAAQHDIEAKERGIALHVRVDDVPDVVLDELALVRILSNLIGNALRHSEPGAGVTVDARRDDDALEIVVTDAGAGIAPEQRAQIGQPFIAAARSHGGQGLGLFIVRSLVEAQGGSLATFSEPGKGSRFTIRFPLASDTRGIGRATTPAIEAQPQAT